MTSPSHAHAEKISFGGSKPRRRLRVLQSVVGLSLLTVFVLFWALVSGRIHGIEFSPSTFTTRTFNYTRFPGTKFRLVSPTYSPSSSVSTFSKNVLRYLKTYPASQQDWHPVTASQGGKSDSYPAAILIQQLNLLDSSNSLFWESWSQVHPDMAAVLWPKVQEFGMQNEYFMAGALLERARIARDLAELNSAVETLEQFSPSTQPDE